MTQSKSKGLLRRTIVLAAGLGATGFPVSACGNSRGRGAKTPTDLVSPALRESLVPYGPEHWPGPLPDRIRMAMGPIVEAMRQAMNDRDLAAIEDCVARARAILGRWDGVPELLSPYGSTIDASPPDRSIVVRSYLDAYTRFVVRAPWEDPRQRSAQPTVRLRVTGWAVEALLRLHAAGLDPDGALLREAAAGLDYAVFIQGSNGAFGYPEIEAGGSALAAQAAARAAEARRQGRELSDRGWIIDDGGDGGLNFDNAVIGCALLFGHAALGNPAYLAAAVRAGEWAIQRPFSPNINYSSMSAFLFARLYRATGETRWREAAREVFVYVVLPTQLSHGRWFDPHNARIQYHSIILRHGLELALALPTGDPLGPALHDALRRGLDSLAGQIVVYGSSNAHELLSAEAPILGERVLGESPLWRAARAIDINHAIRFEAPRLAARGLPLPAAIALHLQDESHASDGPGWRTFEISRRSV